MTKSQKLGVVLVTLSVFYLYMTLFHNFGAGFSWVLYVMGTLGGIGIFLLKKIG